MPAELNGFDQYSGSHRKVTITREDVHVLLEVEDGAAMLTPDQAHALAEGLNQQGRFAASAAQLRGQYDAPPSEKGA